MYSTVVVPSTVGVLLHITITSDMNNHHHHEYVFIHSGYI